MKSERFESMILWTLRAGVILSATLLAAGLLIIFFVGYTNPIGADLLIAGVFALFATPVARVAMSVLLFSLERNRLYTVITIIVLTNVLIAIFVIPTVLGLS